MSTQQQQLRKDTQDGMISLPGLLSTPVLADSINSMNQRSAAHAARIRQTMISPANQSPAHRIRSAERAHTEILQFDSGEQQQNQTAQSASKQKQQQQVQQPVHRFARTGLSFYGGDSNGNGVQLTFDQFEKRLPKNVVSPPPGRRSSTSAGGNRSNRKVLTMKSSSFHKSGGEKQHLQLSATKAIEVDRFSASGIKQKFGGANGLNAQVIELWISDTLKECQREKYVLYEADENKVKPKQTLMEFGLDRKTLRHKGVRSEDVDRLYKNFYVFSIGFYEMLFEILKELNDRDSVIANVWQAYGILLEYCARGEFTTTINVIESRNEAIIESLNKIIHEKQNILQEVEGNEQVVVDKFADLIKDLRSKNDALQEEKNRVDSNNKLLDSQYNQETRMRLQFEYKINELYSIYRELFTKYKRLTYEREDQNKKYVKLKVTHDEAMTEKFQVSVKLTAFATEVESLKREVKILEQESQQKSQAMSALTNKMNVMFANKLHSFEEVQKWTNEISQLTFENSNLKDEYKSRDEQQRWSAEEIQRLQMVIVQFEKDVKEHQEKHLDLVKKLTERENDQAKFSNSLALVQERIVEKEGIIAEKEQAIEDLTALISVQALEISELSMKVEEQQGEIENLDSCAKKYKVQQQETEFSLQKASENLVRATADLEKARFIIKGFQVIHTQ